VWSSNKTHFRLNGGGNRQINAALYRIVLTQIRRDGPGYPNLQRRLAEGRTKAEALQTLKPHLSDEVYRRLPLAELETSDATEALTGAVWRRSLPLSVMTAFSFQPIKASSRATWCTSTEV
jgi:hypothetical protein